MIENAICVVNCVSGPMKRTTHEWLAMNFAEGRAKQFQREGFVVAARNAIIRDVALPLIKELPGIEW